MIIQADVLIGSILHAEPVWHGAGLHKVQPLIQVACVKVVFNHRVKQQNTKPVPLCLRETIENQFFTNGRCWDAGYKVP